MVSETNLFRADSWSEASGKQRAVQSDTRRQPTRCHAETAGKYYFHAWSGADFGGRGLLLSFRCPQITGRNRDDDRQSHRAKFQDQRQRRHRDKQAGHHAPRNEPVVTVPPRLRIIGVAGPRPQFQRRLDDQEPLGRRFLTRNLAGVMNLDKDRRGETLSAGLPCVIHGDGETLKNYSQG